MGACTSGCRLEDKETKAQGLEEDAFLSVLNDEDCPMAKSNSRKGTAGTAWGRRMSSPMSHGASPTSSMTLGMGRMPRSSTQAYKASIKPRLARNSQGDELNMYRRMGSEEGFLISLDWTDTAAAEILTAYGVPETSYGTKVEMMRRLIDMQTRLVSSAAFAQSKIIGSMVSEDNMHVCVEGMKLPMYLWTKVSAVPFLTMSGGLAPEADGVRLAGNARDEDELLKIAVSEGFFGAKVRSVIRLPDAIGIQRLVDQQMDFARRVLDHGLVPILQPEVDIDSPDKTACEQLLLDMLLAALGNASGAQSVILQLTIPTRPNMYLPLVEHPKTIRVAALSGGYSCAEACKKLMQNVGMVASFGRAFAENLHIDQDDEEFTATLSKSCNAMFQASRPLSAREEQRIKVGMQDGFFIAMDPNDRTKALSLYGVDTSTLINDDDWMEEWFSMQTRLFTSEHFYGSQIVGALLGEESTLQSIEGLSLPQYLWDHKRVVPFLRLTHGFQDEVDGVRKMEEVPDLAQALEYAEAGGICGAKVGSMIIRPSITGIKGVVKHQIEYGKAIAARGLIPMLQFEISAAWADKALCERLLFEALIEGVGTLKITEQVVLHLPIPTLPNLFLPLMRHPNVLRVSALSGGVSRAEACGELANNVGLVAGFGRAFLEGLRVDQDDEAFERGLEASCKDLYKASFAVPTKEEQTIKVATMDGFFAAFDDTNPAAISKTLQRYGIGPSEYESSAAASKLSQMYTRVITNPKFNGSRVVGACLAEHNIGLKVSKIPIARYLWEQKSVVLFIKIGIGLEIEKDGVQLLKEIPKLSETLQKAKTAGAFGTKARSIIKSAKLLGIWRLVDQQFRLGRQVMQQGLTPILMIEVDINAPDKAECERLLLHCLLERLAGLADNEKVVFQLTLPTKANLYMPLMAFPNTIRVVALSGGYARAESCRMLAKNVGVIAGFSRALVEGLSADQSTVQYTKTLDASCRLIFNVSRASTELEEQLAKVRSQDGFFAALDQGVNNASKVLQKYGVHCHDDDVLEQIHMMRSRFITSPKFNGARVIGTIFGEDTMNRDIDYSSTARYLWEKRKVVPILRLDSGLQREQDGAQVFKDIHRLDQLLDTAQKHGVHFAKTNCQISFANAVGIKRVVDHQFEVAKKVLARGMVPVLQIEVDIYTSDKLGCENRLRQVIMGALNRDLTEKQRVILVFSIPSKPDMYASLAQHPKVLRIACSSGGYCRGTSCEKLREVPDVIASFGRAFTEGLTVHQTEKEFTDTVNESCTAIYEASVTLPQDSVGPAEIGRFGRSALFSAQATRKRPALASPPPEKVSSEGDSWTTAEEPDLPKAANVDDALHVWAQDQVASPGGAAAGGAEDVVAAKAAKGDAAAARALDRGTRKRNALGRDAFFDWKAAVDQQGKATPRFADGEPPSSDIDNSFLGS